MFGLEKIAPKIEIPPEGVGADLAIPCFREDPQAVMVRIQMLNNPIFKSVAVRGRYVNIVLDPAHLVPYVINEVVAAGETYGWNNDGAGREALIEYSAPNIAKPMHIGHARNNAVGHALVNVYKANGWKVTVTNHFGDWGMSLAKIMRAYELWGNRKEFEADPIRHLLALYVRMTDEIPRHPEYEAEAKALLTRLEAGDSALRAMWQEFRDVSVLNFKRVYALLGIDFDIWNGESFYESMMDGVVQEALDKGVAKYGDPEEGGTGRPIAVDLEPYGLPSFLLKKSDGGSLYAARDLAVVKWRLDNYPKAERIVYVVGHEQELYLKQVFKTMELLGYPADRLWHISYGVVTLDGKKIATRSGNIIFLEDALKEAAVRAKGIAEVGTGAVIYNMLVMGREHDIAFSWDAALSVTGNSAPYIQYAYVRAKSALAKAKVGELGAVPIPYAEAIGVPEMALAKMIARYPQAVRSAHALAAPHMIATYLNELAQEFNRFYAACHIADSGSAEGMRAGLTHASAMVMKGGLALLGIAVPERM